MSTVDEFRENPFEEALNSVALAELLQDDDKRSLAQQFQENLRTLADMFVNLSDEEKRKFAADFKGKFVKTLSHLNEFSKQRKIIQPSDGTGSTGTSELSGLPSQLSSLPLVGFLFSRGSSWSIVAGYMVLLLVLLLFTFFGYKLYLSLTEKERKREEKLKAKQEKSKKKK
ncbi:uncharacterized protein LOC126577062 isoform X1 [Anopheles aquasalis]|uniref:uncharacterized protein LOC126577062 isoform X1 n=1 Tax=Anopheles aquasalis TaxID=42839 RepID=UPI00215B71E1|nr:uncharacterized protein LOC126577062 isoform X1 [Anopheles aquasalis]